MDKGYIMMSDHAGDALEHTAWGAWSLAPLASPPGRRALLSMGILQARILEWVAMSSFPTQRSNT